MLGMRQGVVRDLTPQERHRFGVDCRCGQPCGRITAPFADRMRRASERDRLLKRPS